MEKLADERINLNAREYTDTHTHTDADTHVLKQFMCVERQAGRQKDTREYKTRVFASN